MTTYEKLLKAHGKISDLVGKNEHGENVIVSINDNFAVVTTLQNNGWLRSNTYYPDGTETEEYEK